MIGRPCLALAFVAALTGPDVRAAEDLWDLVRLREVASGLTRPVAITSRVGDPDLYVVEQAGTIVALDVRRHGRREVLDIRGRVRCCGERGLLGMAFSPSIEDRIFVNYTRDPDGATVVSRFAFGDGVADPATESVVLVIPQPFANHNGGTIVFGPDGYLWIGLGDGGSGGDPLNHGQDPTTLLGSMLRIDVSVEPYAIPPDNPFVHTDNAQPEIWAYGLRNPWKFSFDRETGDLWIADVGQGSREEINRERADATGGLNYGWRIMEGDRCFNPPVGCNADGLVLPAATYGHDLGCAVTGGHLYRGSMIDELRGAYVFGDLCSGLIWVIREQTGFALELMLETEMQITTFGEDLRGEVYVADYGAGTIYRLERATPVRRRGAVRR